MHEHHRDRLRVKALKDVKTLSKYEQLELLLFSVVPRKNTNEIAHRLIDEFGSVQRVLQASPDMLVNIEGVGEKTAAFLVTLGSVYSQFSKDEIEFPKFFNFADIRQPLIKLFSPYTEEVFVTFFLDSRQKIISQKTIFGHSTKSVDIDLNDFSKQVVLNNAKSVVIAHNHLGSSPEPSTQDDITTEKICVILSLMGVPLIDHIIVAGEKVYSYYYDNRLDEFRNRAKKTLG